MKYWLVALLAILCIAAVCTEKEAQQYLAEGTDYVFPERKPVDYILILDRSGSMRGQKLDQAKTAAKELINRFTNDDRAAIVTFDSNAQIMQAFTQDKDELIAAVNRIDAGDFTKYSAGLEKTDKLVEGDNRHVIIFLSDGKPDEEEDRILELVDGYTKQEICMFTIAYTEDIQEEAQVILKKMAELSVANTGCGSYHAASENTEDLEEIFTQIYTEISSEGLIEVTTEVNEEDGPPILNVQAMSTLNQQNIFDGACFAPTIHLSVKQGTNTVYETQTQEANIELDLGFGQYSYEVLVEETCGGDCFFTGKANGELNLEQNPELCQSTWEQLSTLLTDQKPIHVRVTPTGLHPRTISTEGVVIWKNEDTKPHKLVIEDNTFVIPELQPGQEYTSYVPAGTHVIRDLDRELIGLVNNEAVYNHDPVDLVLVIDKSGSMAGRPLETAKKAATNLLSVLLPKDRSSLIVFSDKATTLSDLSSDVQKTQNGVDELLSGGSTFYIPPLDQAGKQLGKRGGNDHKVTIFLSDGAPFDDGGQQRILEKVDENIQDACLYTIGYGEESREAEELLRSMSTYIREKNNCGEFLFASTAEGELSRVLGEIYAQTQEERLELYDIEYEQQGKDELYISVKVQSKTNKLSLPAATQFGCIPPAKVSVEVGKDTYTLERNENTYEGILPLSKGKHEARIVARVSAKDEPAKLALGTTRITINTGSSKLWIIILGVIFLLIILGYVFMRAQRPQQNAY